jgi:hypothetical protein
MIVYPFFCPWKTRRAFLRGLLLGGAFLGACYGLEQTIQADAWPAWLETGDWYRCTAAGLLAFPLGLIEYGPRNRDNRAPLHFVALLFLVALVGLLLIAVAPSFGAFTQTLRRSTPEAALRSLLPVIWPAGLCAVNTALVFAAVARERWRGSGLGGQLKAAVVVSVVGSGVGPVLIGLTGATTVAPFVALLAMPLPFALLLPLFGVVVDKVDGRLARLDDLTGGAESAPLDTEEAVLVDDESSGERVFSWGAKAEDEEAEAEAEGPGERLLGPDDDSSGLDGLAARLFEN